MSSPRLSEWIPALNRGREAAQPGQRRGHCLHLGSGYVAEATRQPEDTCRCTFKPKMPDQNSRHILQSVLVIGLGVLIVTCWDITCAGIVINDSCSSPRRAVFLYSRSGVMDQTTWTHPDKDFHTDRAFLPFASRWLARYSKGVAAMQILQHNSGAARDQSGSTNRLKTQFFIKQGLVKCSPWVS